jgi:hypothetical protein
VLNGFSVVAVAAATASVSRACPRRHRGRAWIRSRARFSCPLPTCRAARWPRRCVYCVCEGLVCPRSFCLLGDRSVASCKLLHLPGAYRTLIRKTELRNSEPSRSRLTVTRYAIGLLTSLFCSH